MPEAWQVIAIIDAGLGLSTWYAWFRMRAARDDWVSAWHYWRSRTTETRATYDWWRRAVVLLAMATGITAVVAVNAFTKRATVMPTTAGVVVEARPAMLQSTWP
jgi:hypothetical protein